MGTEQGNHPSSRDLSLQEGTTHLDCGQDLPSLRATPVAAPKVFFTQCRRVSGHYFHKMCHGTCWVTLR